MHQLANILQNLNQSISMEQKLDISIKWFDTVDSTNNLAAENSDSDCDMSVYAADFQRKGRGQRGTRWKSGRGENLTFSILLKPVHIAAPDQFIISAIASLSVARYLNIKGLNSKIKWPNDIYVGDKKICGMLIEHSLAGANLSVSIVGIGINLNQRDFDDDIPNPTSVLIELEKKNLPDVRRKMVELDRKRELTEFMEIFRSYYTMLEGAGCYENMRKLTAEYVSNLYRLGEYHRFVETEPTPEPLKADMGEPHCALNEKEIEARIIGIDPNSCLMLQLRNGDVKSYAFKEIRYVI